MTNVKPVKSKGQKSSGSSGKGQPVTEAFRPPSGRRIFSLDLSDHVAGVWDNNVPLVQQCTVEGVGIKKSMLNRTQILFDVCERICQEFHLNYLDRAVHEFGPGVTVVYLLSESHIAIHSWPENGYLHVDLVTCSKQGVDPHRLSDVFCNFFKPLSIRVHKIYY